MDYERLEAFNEVIDKLYEEQSRRDYAHFDFDRRERASKLLARLIGADEEVKIRWWGLPREVDLELTDDQLRLCKLLAGPHGPTIKRMLELEASGEVE